MAYIPFIAGLVAAWLLAPTPADALRRAMPYQEDSEPDTWGGTDECEIVYYNTCTGWCWAWSGPGSRWWEDHDRVGVVFDACDDHAELTSTWTYFLASVPGGWGYTVVSIQSVDASDCPTGTPIAPRVRHPLEGWNLDVWDEPVPSRFALVQEIRAYPSYVIPANPITTDHPAAAGGGPPACGTCYPTTRETHSLLWGTPAEPLCPGIPFFDGACNAELMVRAAFHGAVAVQQTPWGSLKALYR